MSYLSVIVVQVVNKIKLQGSETMKKIIKENKCTRTMVWAEKNKVRIFPANVLEDLEKSVVPGYLKHSPENLDAALHLEMSTRAPSRVLKSRVYSSPETVLGQEMELLPLEVCSFLQSVPNAEVAEFVAGKQPGSLNEAQDLVAELTAAPLAKTCLVSFMGDDDYGRWLRGTVNGRPASFMLSQNSDSFVSVNAVNRLGLTTSLCRPFSVNLLVGSTAQPSNRKVADLEFELEGGFKGCLDFAVMNLARHDFVLGHELINLCSEYVLSFRDGMKVELECGGQSFTSRFQQGRPQF
ncbi:uncharacterized protein LOC112349934 [Selaginella moellendorffii]|uniref:uncharacterized protein LOC112349934 n=1 Tax=Selaginella moellendorffii TaxID=88036 RepID=UPI000D1CAF22|nr:uncharacterized protein LOC112349934 [Selaginella moellendorffii]|eukprot:XP_024540999.1 uncharacterized protein LOC112349934 [Selaginella moellendorffii]